MRRLWLFALAAAVAGCSSSTRAPGPAGAGSSAGSSAPTPIAVARIGDACAPDRASPQSTCPAGALCAPMPGGYCTAQCLVTDCPAGSVCVPTGRMGDLCAAACTSDADCRAAEGYTCDPGRHACLLPFQAAPSLAACPAEPAVGPRPPRAEFAPIEVLTSASSPGAYQFEPSAAVTPAGDLVILYTGGAASFFEPSSLGVVRVPLTGPAVEQPLPTSKRMHFDPWLTADSRGHLHAVWLGHDGGGVDANAEIGYARSTDGGATWSPPIAVHDPADCPPDTPFCLDKPMIAAGPAPGARGKARVALRVFYAAGDAGLRMRTSLDDGATFDPAVAVVAGAYGDVAIDAAGAVHVVAAAGAPAGPAAWGSTDNAIVYTRASDGRTFSTPVAVSGPGEPVPFFFVNPSLVTDPTGKLVSVAYAAGGPDGAWNIMLASSTDGGATWTRHRVAGTDPACANHAVPELARRQSGKLALTWFEFVDGAGYRAYTVCKADGTGCKTPTPIGPPMATYELVRHSPRWLGEYAALVPDEAHRRLHAVWTQVLGDSPRGTARIVHTVAPGR